MHEKTGFITYTASGTAVIGGLTMTDWAAFIGAGVAIASLLVSIYFKQQHLKLAQQKAREGKEGGDVDA